MSLIRRLTQDRSQGTARPTPGRAGGGSSTGNASPFPSGRSDFEADGLTPGPAAATARAPRPKRKWWVALALGAIGA